MPVDRCMCRRQTKPCSNISAHARYYKKSQISVFLLHNMLALSVGRIFSFADHLTFSPLSPLPSSLLYPLFSPLSPLLSSIPSPLFPSSLLYPLFSPLSPLLSSIPSPPLLFSYFHKLCYSSVKWALEARSSYYSSASTLSSSYFPSCTLVEMFKITL